MIAIFKNQWKSDSVTFMLDTFYDSTSWPLCWTKLTEEPFYSLAFRLLYNKIKIITKYIAVFALQFMISWKIHWMSHYHFCQIWNGIPWFFLDVQVCFWKEAIFGELIPIQFYWRKVSTLFRSQFCTEFCSTFYVTLSGQHICETVQNYVLGHNFFICGRLLNLDIPNCSAWHLW